MVYYWIYHITPNNYIVRSSWCWRIKLPSEGLKESTYFIQMDYGWDRSNNHPKLQWGCSFGKELVPRNAFGNTSNDYPFQDWFSQFLPFSQQLWAQVGFTGHFLKLRNAALVFVDPAAAGSQHFLELHLHPKTQRIDDAAASGDAGGDGTAGGGLWLHTHHLGLRFHCARRRDPTRHLLWA